MNTDEEFLMCIPKSFLQKPHTASTTDKCCKCEQEVWRAASSPKSAKALCMLCMHKMVLAGEKIELAGATAEQVRDILEHL